MSLILDALKKAEVKRSQSPKNKDSDDNASQIIDRDTDAINAAKLKQLAAKNWGMLCACIFLLILVIFLISLLIGGKAQTSTVNENSDYLRIQRAKAALAQGFSNSTNDKNAIDSLYSQTNELSQKKPDDISSLYENNIDDTTERATREFNFKKRNIEIGNDSASTYSQNEYGEVKNLKTMSASFQETIPTLMYSQHQYSDGGNSMVVINKVNLYEGSVLNNDIEVVAILEHSVILSSKNTQFRLSARNSWINF